MVYSPERALARLAEPFVLGSVTLKNRIYLPSHTYGFVRDGKPTADFIPYVARRLRGGVSLIVLGETVVLDPTLAGNRLWGEAVAGQWLVPFYASLVERATVAGAHIFEQLFHPGGQTWSTPGSSSFGPSRVHHSTSAQLPWAMTQKDITRIIKSFGRSVGYAISGHLSGVELKADQGKLHHQFLSPQFNRRPDLYGLEEPKSFLFLRQTLEEMRSVAGSAMVIGVRLPTGDGWDTVDQNERVSSPPEWLAGLLAELEAAKLVDYVSLSHGTNSTRLGYRAGHADESLAEANIRYVASAIRDFTTLPLFVTSNVRSVWSASGLLADGIADMVGMVRAQIADPDLVRKALSGAVADIRPCVAANQGCVGNAWVGRPIRCLVNPEAGRERLISQRLRARSELAVSIVGGGPAGLEAALRLASAGCQVTLHERGDRLGGQLRSAQTIPGRNGLGGFQEYLIALALKSRAIDIRLGQEVTDITELRSSYDAVIVANGSLDSRPWSILFEEIGAAIIDLPYWQSASEAAFDNSQPPGRGERVLVIDFDWTQSALGIAADLAARGAVVTYTTPMEVPGGEIDYVTQTVWLGELRRRGAQVLTSVEPFGVDQSSIFLRDIVAGELIDLGTMERVIVAATREPAQPDLRDLADVNCPVIGDARYPRGLESALADAAVAVRNLIRPSRGKEGDQH